MEEIKDETWEFLEKKQAIIFIYTPFCATCQLAEKMLYILEEADNSRIIYQMNASFYPDFMTNNKIESVPALVLWDGKSVQDRIYAMESVTKLFNTIGAWERK